MKLAILGLVAFVAVVHASVIPLQSTATLVRTPYLDSAVIQSERNNGAFSYSTVENQAYAPLIQTVSEKSAITCDLKYLKMIIFFQYASYPWSYYPIYYPQAQQPIYPTYTFVQQNPQYIPGATFPSGAFPGATLPGPGQPPIEVTDPADNTENQDLTQGGNFNSDDDTVSVESA
jgi:hypothetical protein